MQVTLSNVFFSTNDLTYIHFECPTSKSKDKVLKFLVDTGASISLVKSASLNHYEITNHNPITLNGLSPNAPLQTLGETNLELVFRNSKIRTNFHVLDSDSNIPFDGLIGDDFLRSQNAKIDYAKSTIILNCVSIPMPLYRNSPQANIGTISVNPRTETVVPVKLNNPYNLKEGVVFSHQFSHESLMIPNAILPVLDNDQSLITIINTSNKRVTIPTPTLHLEPLSQNSYVYSLAPNISNNHVSNRIKTLESMLRLDHLNSEEKTSIQTICHEFNDIFHLPTDMLTKTTLTTATIPTINERPIHAKTYRFPAIHKKEVEKQIETMLQQGIITPSTSPWSSPLWVVPKKPDASGEKKWRIVIDYRKLNEQTIGDAYPLPNIEDILDHLGHAIYFSTLDLYSGFSQIPMDPKDAPKTAFTTPQGHFQSNRLSFGLKNSPAIFQRMMNTALAGLTSTQCFVYVDDIVIYGSSLEDHNRKLQNVMSRLRQHNLKLQPSKCEFLKKSCEYLGHVISDKGVSPNPKKIECVVKLPRPKTEKDIKSFLGMTGFYRKFISDYSTIAKPLTALLRKDTPFLWSHEQETAFQTLKQKLINHPILQYPDFNQPFILTCDASNVGIGSVLSQMINDKDLPIAYYSRTLNSAEQNYSTTEKELLAIVNSVEHFRPYLFGQQFTIYTDHRPLQWLFNCQNPSSKLVRWRLRLSEYQYTIKYKPGRVNSNADGLSRLPVNSEESPVNLNITTPLTFNDFVKFHYHNQDVIVYDKDNSPFNKLKGNIVIPWSCDLDEHNVHSEYVNKNFDVSKLKPTLDHFSKSSNSKQTLYLLHPTNMFFDKIEYKNLFECFKNLKKEMKSDSFTFVPPKTNLKLPLVFEMLKFIFPKNNIRIFDTNKIIPNSRDEIKRIFQENHDSKLSGHYGFNKTYSKIKTRYYWPSMKSDIRSYIKTCDSCQKNKTNFKPTKQPMQITTTSEKPFERLALDIVGPLPITEHGHRFILTSQDDLTKYSFAIAIPNHESLTIAKSLTKIITYFGIPKTILTDQGADFMSQLIKDLTNLFKTKHVTSTPYHPQTNGSLERSHLTLKDYLKHYINNYQNDWDEYIDFAMFSYNTSVHKSTSFTPYELLFGHKAHLPSSITRDPEFSYSYDDYVKSLQHRLNTSFQLAKQNILQSKQKSKELYDKKTNEKEFCVNDMVLLYDNQTKPRSCKKLSPDFKGPFKIVNTFPNGTVELELGKNKKKKYHTNLLKHYFVAGN